LIARSSPFSEALRLFWCLPRHRPRPRRTVQEDDSLEVHGVAFISETFFCCGPDLLAISSLRARDFFSLRFPPPFFPFSFRFRLVSRSPPQGIAGLRFVLACHALYGRPQFLRSLRGSIDAVLQIILCFFSSNTLAEPPHQARARSPFVSCRP